MNIAEKENLTPEYLKLHPKGVVPALIDDGHVIIESTIIMEYLDTNYDTDSLKPEGAYAQTLMRKWTKWVDETLHPNWAGLGWTILVRPSWLNKTKEETDHLLSKLIDPLRRDRQRKLLEEGFDAPEYLKSMKVLDQTLGEMEKLLSGRDWLVGGKPTLADLAVLPYVISAEKFGLEIMYREGRPSVAAWIDRCKARPTYDATMPWQLPDDLASKVRLHGTTAWSKIRAIT